MTLSLRHQRLQLCYQISLRVGRTLGLGNREAAERKLENVVDLPEAFDSCLRPGHHSDRHCATIMRPPTVAPTGPQTMRDSDRNLDRRVS